MVLQKKKTIIILSVIIILMIGFALIHQQEEKEQSYNEAVNKVETEFQVFVENTAAVIAGEDISFEEFTEWYMQLRVRLSKWTHLYDEMRIWEKPTFSANYGYTSAGEFGLAVEDLYYNIVHMYYIKDMDADETAIMDECNLLMDDLKEFTVKLK